jgi:hypothetical protein
MAHPKSRLPASTRPAISSCSPRWIAPTRMSVVRPSPTCSSGPGLNMGMPVTRDWPRCRPRTSTTCASVQATRLCGSPLPRPGRSVMPSECARHRARRGVPGMYASTPFTRAIRMASRGCITSPVSTACPNGKSRQRCRASARLSCCRCSTRYWLNSRLRFSLGQRRRVHQCEGGRDSGKTTHRTNQIAFPAQ